MRDVRLTLRAEDFGAIWSVLLEQGIGFRVDPAETPQAEPTEVHGPAATPAAKIAAPKPIKAKPATPPSAVAAKPTTAPTSLPCHRHCSPPCYLL